MQAKTNFSFDRVCAEIRVDAILHNFDAISARLPSDVKKMAVVKADAYGHGAVPVAKALETRADCFAVACTEEAVELREAGIAKPILILGHTSPELYGTLLKKDLTATLYSVEDARLLSETACRAGARARIHIAVDTGMGRIGVSPDEKGADGVARIAELPGIDLEGVFSHFACADEESLDCAKEQEACFDRFLALLEQRGVSPGLRHICNSAASLRMEQKYDLVRLGIALYGYAPNPQLPPEIPLEPAMTVKSRVIFTKQVEKGTGIGYGHVYRTPGEKRIATVAIGYGDGYNRCIFEKGYVLLRGKRAPITGRICMDQMMVDVTEIPEVRVGDTAILLGKSGEEEISADLLGSWANSFSYEVLCTFLPRVKRIYL